MASQISLYNAALFEIGETKLSSLSETRKPRYDLDEVYSRVVLHCLGQGHWNFATRTVSIDPDAIDPAFGYQYAFEKPSDWVKTTAISPSGLFDPPLNGFEDEGGYWHTNVNPLFVKYVSSHADYGLDLTAWPETFTRYVELALAHRICKPVSDSSTMKADLEKEMKRALADAKSKDASNEPARFPPRGSWSTARSGGWATRGR